MRKRKNLGFPNSIEIAWGPRSRREFFTSFLSREDAFRLIMAAWHQSAPEKAEAQMFSSKARKRERLKNALEHPHTPACGSLAHRMACHWKCSAWQLSCSTCSVHTQPAAQQYRRPAWHCGMHAWWWLLVPCADLSSCPRLCSRAAGAIGFVCRLRLGAEPLGVHQRRQQRQRDHSRRWRAGELPVALGRPAEEGRAAASH